MQDLTVMLASRLDCPLSLKAANMGNPGYDMTEEDLRASSVLKRATRALRQGGVSDEEIEAYTKEATLLLQPPDVHHHDVGADIVRSALGSLDRC